MTRAVIKLKRDIGPLMPLLEKNIEGCAYSARQPVAAFRYYDYRVVVENRQIMIAEAETEATAREIIDFIRNAIESGKILENKLRGY